MSAFTSNDTNNEKMASYASVYSGSSKVPSSESKDSFGSGMSAFVKGVLGDENPSSEMQRRFGENGHAELTAAGLGDSLLALFDKLVRELGDDETRIREYVRQVIMEARSSGDLGQIKNLFVLVFQTRWCRGGKGERRLTYKMLKILYEDYPAVVVALLPLLPEFGYWDDLNNIVAECIDHPVSGVNYASLFSTVWKTFASQMKIDLAALHTATAEGKTPELTFCFKYAPTEGHADDKKIKTALGRGSVDFICQELFPHVVGPVLRSQTPKQRSASWKRVKSLYRKQCTEIRASLDLPEVKECAHRFAEINFAKMPARCLKGKMKAYLNEQLKVAPSMHEEGGNRHPDDPDRVAAREHLLKTLVEKGVKGGQCDPHELVGQVFGKGVISSGVRAVLNGQWNSLRENVVSMTEARRKALEELGEVLGVDTGKLVVMSDVSGSMSGDPMLVSIGMGILVSEICHPAFRNLVLTFSSRPQFHDLSKCSTFCDKVASLAHADWGGNTDFKAAMNRIASVVEAKRLTQEEIPDMLVVSDMQFDEARSSGGYGSYGYGRGSKPKGWETSYEKIRVMFHDLGMKVHGVPFDPPKIIFWNVRATEGFPAAADQEGVMLMSGYSPALMKFVLSGEMEAEVEVVDKATGEVTTVKRQITPREALHKVLTDSGLDPVRDVLATVEEHLSVGF
jgi:hypothetical protein